MQVISELASKLNKQALPELSEKPGLQIPVNSLMGPGYQLTVPAETSLPSGSDSGEAEAGGGAGSTFKGVSKQTPAIQINVARQEGGQEGGEMEWTDAV